MWSTGVSMLTLVTSVIAVSLTNTSESTGPLSETALLRVFLDADEDGNGELTEEELKNAVALLGPKDQKLRTLEGLIAAQKAASANGLVTFADWFDIVSGIAESDGLAAYHNVVTWGIVHMFNKVSAPRRANALGKDYSTRRSMQKAHLSRISPRISPCLC